MIYLESKFDGDIGILGRKHVQADSVVYIGKEAERLGVGRSTFQVIKKRIMESGDVNFSTPAVERLIHSLVSDNLN